MSSTHDYSSPHRRWGHDYVFEPIEGGLRGRAMGWGEGLEAGDYVILDNEPSTTRYRIEFVRYFLDPPDMWSADLVFAPREVRSA